MRGRRKEPEGKRVAISVKVSERMAAGIDAACGGDRSAWVRGLIAAALGPPAPHGITIITDERMPPGTAALVSRGRDGTAVSAFSLGAEEAPPDRSRQPVRGPVPFRPPHSLTCKCAICKPPREEHP